MTDKITAILNILIPAAFGGAASVAGIKAWSNRPESLARAKKINIEAYSPVVREYQSIILNYESRLKETEDRWEKRFNDQSKYFTEQINSLQGDLEKCRRGPSKVLQ